MDFISPFSITTYNKIYFESGKEKILVQFGTDGEIRWTWSSVSPSLGLRPFSPFSQWPHFRSGVCSFYIDLADKRRSWDVATQANKSDLHTRLRLHLENIIYILWGSSWPNNDERFLWDRAANRFRWIWFPFLVAVVILDVCFFKKYRRIRLLPLLNLVGWFSICVLPCSVGEGRYRMPFEGLLIANALWLAGLRFNGHDKKSDPAARLVSEVHF